MFACLAWAFLAAAWAPVAAGFFVDALAFFTSLAALYKSALLSNWSTQLIIVNVCRYLIACSRWALRTSGFWFLFFMISSRVAPVMARWNLANLRDFFLVSASTCQTKSFIINLFGEINQWQKKKKTPLTWPFLCLRLYKTVQLISLGLRLKLCEASHFRLMKINVY